MSSGSFFVCNWLGVTKAIVWPLLLLLLFLFRYGEIVNINLVKEKKTGKSKGYCFLAYEDQRSTVLAVDNFNGIKVRGRGSSEPMEYKLIRMEHERDHIVLHSSI